MATSGSPGTLRQGRLASPEVVLSRQGRPADPFVVLGVPVRAITLAC
jgi:hypothetical protein